MKDLNLYLKQLWWVSMFALVMCLLTPLCSYSDMYLIYAPSIGYTWMIFIWCVVNMTWYRLCLEEEM